MVKRGSAVRVMMLAGLMFGGVVASGCGGADPMKTVHEPNLLDNDVLQERVQLALKRAGKEFDGVKAHAAGGTVTLTGNVASQDDRAKAEQVARGVYRVQQVQDQIQVGEKQSATRPTSGPAE